MSIVEATTNITTRQGPSFSIPPGLHFVNKTVQGIGPWLWPDWDDISFDMPAAMFPELRDIVLKACKRQGCIIQAGGCCGMYPRLWAEAFQLVVTFEPEVNNFYCLSYNCRTKENIAKFQCGLSDRSGMGTLQRAPRGNAGMWYIVKNDGFVPLLSLDSFQIPQVDVLQLDCEGMELDVLQGAQQTINKFKPVIAVEASDIRPVEHFLGERGYRPLGITSIPKAGCQDVVFSAD